MFPTPQTALPLPPSSALDRSRKAARELLKACKSHDPGCALHAFAQQWVASLVQRSGLVVTPHLPVDLPGWIDGVEHFARRVLLPDGTQRPPCRLAGAQFVVARAHGFASWPKLLKFLREMENRSSAIARFEAAVEAIIAGNAAALGKLLLQQPGLPRMHSLREHAATLLHYTTANGVEGYRQRTPPNIVAIAEILLQSGAAVNATASVYGSECTALELAATSGHPERAGVQQALLQSLLDRGATMEASPADGIHKSLVAGCLANGRPAAAAFLARSGAPLDLAAAAGLGQLDTVKAILATGRTPTRSRKRTSPGPQLQASLFYACAFGHNAVVTLLLQHGADIAAPGRNGQTALHWAVIGARLDTVQLLLKHNPPLEACNSYGGTVVGQALWSAAHSSHPASDAGPYLAILAALRQAGAKLPAHHAPINPPVDEWLAQQGSCVGPAPPSAR